MPLDMEIDTAYQEALDYLYSFVDYSLTRAFRYSADKFDLDRMRSFMEVLGRPDQRYPIIHIAGTKGKGSIAALCASALQAAGYRTGLYTSPHLQDYRERIQINGVPISHEDFIALVDEFRPLLDGGTPLTTFEISTALAFLYFARQGVTAAVIEVGLGGRLDATNVITPRTAVIASISYDHTQFLGSTLAEIAAEKGGIIKPGVPVVISPQKDEARIALEQIASTRGAPLVEVGRDYRYEMLEHSFEKGQSFLVWPAGGVPANGSGEPRDDETQRSQAVQLRIPLLGHHQVENAATAYAALQTAARSGIPIDEQAVQAGFARVNWPARFEILRPDPPLVVDAAHNRDSALQLRRTLEEYFPGKPVILIFGASEDKDIQGMFAELLPYTRQVVATRSYHPRALEPEALEELARPYNTPVLTTGSVEEALDEALRLAGSDALVLAAGSVFVAAGVREVWLQKQKKTIPQE